MAAAYIPQALLGLALIGVAGLLLWWGLRRVWIHYRLRRANRAYGAARDAYAEARRRGDTRKQHEAVQAMQAPLKVILSGGR